MSVVSHWQFKKDIKDIELQHLKLGISIEATLHANLQSVHGVSYNFELWTTPNQPSSRTPPIHGRQMLTEEKVTQFNSQNTAIIL